MPVDQPLFLDWTFWAVLVSVLALVLSQLPPVHLWFRGAAIEIDAYRRIAIGHKVGNPNVTIHVLLHNVGGRTLRIKQLRLDLTRNGTPLMDLPLQNYFERQDSSGPLIFTPFSLEAGEEWSHAANFLEFFDRDDERAYKALESGLRRNIHQKRVENPDQLVEADAELVAPILEFFESKFRWRDGDYGATLHVITDRGRWSKKYRFTIFESESAELRALADDYKYGAGVFWDRQGITTVIGPELHEVTP